MERNAKVFDLGRKRFASWSGNFAEAADDRILFRYLGASKNPSSVAILEIIFFMISEWNECQTVPTHILIVL